MKPRWSGSFIRNCPAVVVAEALSSRPMRWPISSFIFVRPRASGTTGSPRYGSMEAWYARSLKIHRCVVVEPGLARAAVQKLGDESEAILFPCLSKGVNNDERRQERPHDDLARARRRVCTPFSPVAVRRSSTRSRTCRFGCRARPRTKSTSQAQWKVNGTMRIRTSEAKGN